MSFGFSDSYLFTSNHYKFDNGTVFSFGLYDLRHLRFKVRPNLAMQNIILVNNSGPRCAPKTTGSFAPYPELHRRDLGQIHKRANGKRQITSLKCYSAWIIHHRSGLVQTGRSVTRKCDENQMNVGRWFEYWMQCATKKIRGGKTTIMLNVVVPCKRPRIERSRMGFQINDVNNK